MSVNNEAPRPLAFQQKPLILKLEPEPDSALGPLSRSALQAVIVAAPHRIFGGPARFPRAPEAADASHLSISPQTLEYSKFDSRDTACSATNETCKPFKCTAPAGLLLKRPPEVPSHRIFGPVPTSVASISAQLRQQVKIEHLSSADEDSEATSGAQQRDEEAEALSQLAMQLVEKNRLSLGTQKAALSDFEKLFVSNLVYIMTGRRVSPEQDCDAFVREVNSSLRQTRQKRKDAQLRFVYKRAVKMLMSKVTGYIANKTYQMHNFAQDFLRYYFPALCKEEDRAAPDKQQDIMDTSYASKKKYLKLFELSPLFKKDFLEYALPLLQQKYAQYSLAIFGKMARHLRAVVDHTDAKLKRSKVEAELSREPKSEQREHLLFKRFKRVPWSAKELDEAVCLVKSFGT